MANCNICPHNCEGDAVCGKPQYGEVSSVAVDPIEKKPLYRFHPGRPILSIGGFGCNLRCPFCQNHDIAMGRGKRQGRRFSPKEIVAMAKDVPDNIGVAYTYNEPVISYDFVYDCARAVKDAGMGNVLVTNGFINREPLEALLPYVDAMNIDLKGFSEEFYKKLGGSLQPVKDTIAAASGRCHVEVTTLVIPGENESHVELIAEWLSRIDADIPYHISRFFPRHEYADRAPTSVEEVFRLCEVAGRYLRWVFAGNV